MTFLVKPIRTLVWESLFHSWLVINHHWLYATDLNKIKGVRARYKIGGGSWISNTRKLALVSLEKNAIWTDMQEIDKIIERFNRKYSDIECGQGLAESEVRSIERQLDVTFPADYKYFLQKYGYFTSDGPDILGAGCDPDFDEYYSMVFYTIDDRSCELPTFFKPRPQHTVIVGPYGGGGHFFLHCEESANAGQVELLLDELHGKADSKKWTSFSEFLNHYWLGP